MTAFWHLFLENYNIIIRSKELGVEPESLRGFQSNTIAHRNIPVKLCEKYSGNYVAAITYNYDCR